MTHRSLIPLAAGAMLVFGLPASGSVDEDRIFVCDDGRGEVVYQTTPCLEVEPPKSSKPAPAAKKVARSHPAPQRRTASTSPPTRFGAQTFPTRLRGGDTERAPAFDSPQSTWRTFLAAIESGDPAGAASCLTADALEGLPAAFPIDRMRGMLRSFQRIEDEGDLGVFWSAYGVRAGRRPKWILFEETARGVWKIAGI